MRKSISINDVDCSTIFTRYGYSVSYTKIRGDAGGTMLDGSTTEDVIAIKAVVTFSFMPQTEEELNAFLNLLYNSDYAKVNYFDPKAKDYRTIEAIYSEITSKHVMTNVNDDELWITGQLTLTER